MNNDRQWLVLGYQWAAQGMIAYLLLYPLAVWLQKDLSLLGFVAMLVSGFPLLYGSWIKEWPFLHHFVSPLVIAIIGLTLGLYWLFCLVLAGVLVWRFHQKKDFVDYGEELSLFVLTILIVFVEMLIFRDLTLIVSLLIQTVLILGGFTTVQYIHMSGRSKSPVLLISTYLAMTLFILGMTVFIFPVKKILGVMWFGISYAFLTIVRGLLTFLIFLGVPLDKLESIENQNVENLINGMELTEEEIETSQQLTGTNQIEDIVNTIGWGTIGVVTLAVLLLLLILYRFRSRNGSGPISSQMVYEYQSLGGSIFKNEPQSVFHRSKTQGIVRKEFLKFERYASKLGYGRRPQESISEWFDRIELGEAELILYRKARYGEETLSDQEIDQYRQELMRLKNVLDQKEEKQN